MTYLNFIMFYPETTTTDQQMLCGYLIEKVTHQYFLENPSIG